MPRFVLCGSILVKILIAVSCLLACACVLAPVALAQHGGGHMGGGGMHFSTGGRIAAPHVSAPPSSHAIWHPHFWSGPPAAGIGANSFRFRRYPIHPLPPVFPIYGYGYPFFFGGPFFGYGLGWGFNSIWWPTCGPYWGWQFGCNPLPFYEYGSANYAPSYSQGTPPTYEYPLYPYREEGRDLPELYLNDGTVYDVTDYWLVDGQLHFTTNEATEDGGLKPVDHVIDFDQLDLQTTIDANTQRGFRFVLRNEPLQQYLQDHPDLAPPSTPPQND